MPSKILIIDDNLGPSKLAEGVLAQHFHGGDVMVALRAMDAFERFGIAQPDLILLNESLPDLDCESVCYRLLNDPATATVPLVLMGNETKTTEISQRYSNVARVIAKPVTADSLQDVSAPSCRRAAAAW